MQSSLASLTAAGLPLWYAHELFGAAAADDEKAAKKVAANDKITMGIVGCGSPQSRSLQVVDASRPVKELQYVAVCDVDRRHVERAKAVLKSKHGFDCETYSDFRQLNDRKDLSAVLVATPDHWHAQVAIDAMRKGKDVYCEKPLTLTVEEALAVQKVAKETGRVLQTGSQQRTEMLDPSTKIPRFRLAVELVRNGRIGKVQRIECRIGSNPVSGVIPEAPVPEGLDWDFWLGPTPKVPYRVSADGKDTNCHYQFRWWYDYSGGKMTDWGAHHLDVAQWALDMDGSGPVAVEAIGKKPQHTRDGYNCHEDFDVTYTYANGATVNAVSKNTHRDARFAHRRFDNGVIILGEGDKWIFVSRGTIEASDKKLIDEPLPPDAVQVYPTRPTNHVQNFIDCVKSREKPICNVEVGASSVIVCHIGAIALRTGKDLKWDSSTHRFNDDAANAMLSRPRRDPWKLDV
jgi:predicted dehydrogenase